MQSAIRWRLALSFATIALLAALLLGAILLALLLQSYSARERAYLEGNAAAISSTLTQYSAAGPSTGSVSKLVEGLAFLSQARVRWLDAAGERRVRRPGRRGAGHRPRSVVCAGVVARRHADG